MTERDGPDRERIGISVVVPSLNQGRFIDQTIRSLLDQNYPNLEVLVMDGGSTDDTIQRLEAYGDQIRWASEKDEGQTDAIIKGFGRTTKPWITWLNSDDVQYNRGLWRVDEAVAADPAVEVVVGRAHYMDEDGSNPRPYPTIDIGPDIDVRKEIFEKGYMAQPSIFFRRDLYEGVGGLNGSLKFCMDYDLWARFVVSGAKFAKIDADISGNRWYPDTKTAGQTLDLYAEIVATQHRVFGAVSPYYVQAVSDYLYAKFHAKSLGDRGHLFFRWLYFKGLWVAINARAPLYCVKGLALESIAKSGPIVGDRMKLKEWGSGLIALLKPRRKVRPWPADAPPCPKHQICKEKAAKLGNRQRQQI
jgi:glycosyltransferase involved in cell wall biosynthesis